jgi:hypothetical protein
MSIMMRKLKEIMFVDDEAGLSMLLFYKVISALESKGSKSKRRKDAA